MDERKTAEAESRRLAEDADRARNWKRFGPYLAERQWGTVREDYSEGGEVWTYFPHDHARSRAYRWGEDGLLGICDREGRLCFALALWNERDPILKERLFGLTGPEGNHGEDVKECYYYLDSTPTHSYFKALYKYPQAEFPYRELVEKNRTRTKEEPEYELIDTGVFSVNRYFDVFAEYAKASPDDLLIRISIFNRGPEPSPLQVLPSLWFRNSWSWGRKGEGYPERPRIEALPDGTLVAAHPTLGRFVLRSETRGELLFTENETNVERLFGARNSDPHVKDAFHSFVVGGLREAVNPEGAGTKAALHHRAVLAPEERVQLRLRLTAEGEARANPFSDFDKIFAARIAEADAFHAPRTAGLTAEEARVVRQANAGLLWSKQFYHLDVRTWLEGDPAQPAPPAQRASGRNSEWRHLYNRDVLSMPDKWEYPWYAAWDLAFHTVPLAAVDPHFAQEQLLLLLREWYMHPNGQVPAYEFAFGDVNPPVHAWAVLRVYQLGSRDRKFLARAFHKLLLNFTWWVNRKDAHGNNLFSGGFLGLDNIGVFDRSKPLPTGGHLEQADGTGCMAFYCVAMLSIALELAREDETYDDFASKFLEHFVAIVDAINCLGGCGLWDKEDGFYYDQLHLDGREVPLRVRSMVGLIPLIAVDLLEQEVIDRLPGFRKRLYWFLENRRDLSHLITFQGGAHGHALLAVPSREQLVRILRYLLDEEEFLSPFGLRSLSRVHAARPFALSHGGEEFRVAYSPGESTTGLFGGNSNWRGPVWFPLNYLIVEALERYHHFYGDSLRVECPTGSGQMRTLGEVAQELSRRLSSIFIPGPTGARPCHGEDALYARDPHFRDLLLFHEYFHGDTGLGLGASHQTGWTALVTQCLRPRGAGR